MNEYIAKYLKGKSEEPADDPAAELIALCNTLSIEPTVFYAAMKEQVAV